ncbi:MAG TPA: Lrp/AsnC family transcriptional regulator [Aggregatilineales bacterium]|nr:Lrp/AsnC family transcriptional regulator [Anaerolineales bacterium]HRE48724.1 Lrp/AsnC family transcriptional regulator [Aggregatilineales bacterium]
MHHALLARGFDQLDHAILDELQEDGRISVAELARKIHLSAPAVHQRIKRLERAGIIQRYAALVDRESVGYDLLCFVRIGLHALTPPQQEALRAALREIPAVLECYGTAGTQDLMLKVVAHNHRELDALLNERLAALPGVERIETSLVLNEIKPPSPLKVR